MIPNIWAKCLLNDVADLLNGYAFPSKDYKGKGIPLIRQSNLAGSKINIEKCIFLDPKYLEEKEEFILKKNDILIGMSGSIGKLCIYDLDVPALQNQRTGKVIFYSKNFIDEKFVWYFFNTIEQRLLEKGKGLGVSNVSGKDILSLPLNLSPLNEQHRIVAKLEKLLAKVDKCKERLEKIPAILKRFRQSVLAAAYFGHLTSDWRKDKYDSNPVSDIVGQIKKRRLKKAKNLAEREKIEEVYSLHEKENSDGLPTNWQYVYLNKLCESFQYGTSRKSEPTGKITVLRMGNIQNSRIDWTDLLFTSDDQDIKKYRLDPGDVLFNRTNSPELVGKTGIYLGEKPAIFAGYLIRIRNLIELDSKYLNYCLDTIYAKDFCLREKTDGVSQSNINAQKLGRFEIPFCCLEEQKEIVRRVEALFKTADRVEARYQKAKAQVDKLTQSILAKAFRGELVPQDPNDEPAAELLKRIKVEKAKTIAESTTRKTTKKTTRRRKGSSAL